MENREEEMRMQLVVVDVQKKFVTQIEEELIRRYADHMAVQIITETEAAESFFAETREIDVLLTEEESYVLVRKNARARHTLLLASEVFGDDSIPESVEVIMNYVPSAEIFHRIEELFQEYGILTRDDVEEPEHNTRIIAVYSPIGGCGKSLVSYALAKKLRKLDQKVLLVSCDPTQSVGVYFNRESFAKDELADKLVEPGEDTYWTILQNIEQDEISYLLPFEKNLTSLGIGMAQWELLLTVLSEKKDFDYIVLDIGTLLDRGTAALLAKANFMILITETNLIANKKMQKLLRDSDLLPKCECFLVANEYRADGMRMAAESVFGTIAAYQNWEDALDDPVFYQIALKVTE